MPRTCTPREITDSPRYPDEVSVTDVVDDAASTTPSAEQGDDFFSSWDKPTIKRPSNPPSRTATPSNISRTASPFLSAAAQNGRKSPLNASSTESGTAAPTSAPRTVTTSNAIRKTATSTARKTNVLGAKKNKLGAKKITADSDIDFDAAERKAKEEAERIAKLGYNPDDDAEVAKAAGIITTEPSKVVSPTPVNPSRSAANARGTEGSSAEVTQLGMGVARLGFGQTVSKQPAAAAKKAGGFGFGQTTRPTRGIYPYLMFRVTYH